AGGKKQNLLLAKCPSGRLKARGDIKFVSGDKLSGEIVKPCKPKGEEERMLRKLTITAIATAAMLALSSLAFAAEVSRSEYKTQVEPICQQSSKPNERILKGVRQRVKQGKLKPAAAKFQKAGQA